MRLVGVEANRLQRPDMRGRISELWLAFNGIEKRLL